VSESDVVFPLVTELRGNFPNPFNPETTISFSLAKDSNVTIEIFNIRGQKIRTLVSNYYQIGSYNVVWNGRDDNGNQVGSGIYFYRMNTGEYQAVRRMILMK